MIDLHTHSIFSDGELLPTELIRRAMVNGCEAVAITDHVDATNLEHVVSCLKDLSYIRDEWDIRALVGVELTHVPPGKIDALARRARGLGAELVVVHGETTVEPVPEGTNRAALLADIDILAHPGLISIEEAELARENGVYLEITARCGHNRTNGHVARTAKDAGANLILNTDAHSPDDLITERTALTIARGAGMSESEARALVSKPLRGMKIIK
ncbi:MAG TPA: histidinol phosphate phosphatase domain-containing protein [Candidatus Methanoperedenaceae archaeon]|nr:histidinol phosphate phosphatase domain-containing protein [Candidatus Methanoperedenaceae archaeon]